jgi:D-apiose dehydrogenase
MCETQRRNAAALAEDTATMLLRHKAGGVSVIDCSFSSFAEPDPFPETHILIEGDRGSAALGFDGVISLVTAFGSERILTDEPLMPWMERPWHVSQAGAFHACRHFLHCLKHGVPAETRGEDNLKTFALVEAAYASAASGHSVEPQTWSAASARSISGSTL